MMSAKSTGLAEIHSPLYKRIEKDLRERVQCGRWAAGTMLPSRKSLADEYGVDMRTIQRAIGDLLADGTLHAHGGRGTFVANSNGTSIPGTPSSNGRGAQTVAIIAEQSYNPGPSWPVTIQAIHETLRREISDCRLITLNTYDKTPEGVIHHERDAVAVVEQQNLAGLIMFHSGGDETIPDIRRVLDRGIPMVFIDRLPADLKCDFVGIDNRFAAFDAVEYLISIGHRRVAFLAPEEDASTIEGRLAGYREALAKNGIEQNPDHICRLPLTQSFAIDNLRSELGRVASRLMNDQDRPTAIFVVNDFLARHFIHAIEEQGGSVPESISVLGFDDVEQFSPRPGFLTSVRQPFEAIGERSAKLLLNRLHDDDGASVYQHILLPTKLVVRSSTQPFSGL